MGDMVLKDTALAMAGAMGAARRMFENPVMAERIEQAFEAGDIAAAMQEIDRQLTTMQDAYVDLAKGGE
jgi:hypothetical protein